MVSLTRIRSATELIIVAVQAPAMPNGRCRMQGGASTGPRTPEGLERCRRARWRHGARSRQVRELLKANRQRWRALLVLIGD